MFLDREILQPLASLKDVQLDDTELDLGRRFVLRNKTEITEVAKSLVIQTALPWGVNFNAHTHTIPTEKPVGIPTESPYPQNPKTIHTRTLHSLTHCCA